LAVAALAVAGVVGFVWAASPITSPTKSVSAGATMGASFQIETKAEITVTPNNPKDQDLVYDVTENALINVTNFGNLGKIAVKTNSAGWDIKMSTANGGRLKSSEYETSHWTWNTNIFGEHTDSTLVSDGGAEFLTFATNTSVTTDAYTDADGMILGDGVAGEKDTVLLRVAIGIAKSGKANGAGTPATIYPMLNMTTGGAVVPPIVIDNEGILTTKRGAATANNDPYNYAALSFAEVISAGYDAGGTGTAPIGKFVNGIDGKTPTGRGWDDLATYGFPIPQGNEVADEEYFYVNVGIDPTMFDAGLAGNKEGNYEETFSFELVANF